jgi:hypothetical protein
MSLSPHRISVGGVCSRRNACQRGYGADPVRVAMSMQVDELHLADTLDGVLEVVGTEARIIGREDMEAIRERGDQVAKLMRRGRKPPSSSSFGFVGSPASRQKTESRST